MFWCYRLLKGYFPPFFSCLGVILFLCPEITPAASSSPISIEGKTFSFDQEKQESNYQYAHAVFRDWTIQADEIQHNLLTQKISFQGNVFITSPTLLFTAKTLNISLYDDKIALNQASVFDPKEQLYIQAETITRNNGASYNLSSVTLTNCRPEEPAWEIYTSSMLYRLEHFSYGYNAIFFLYGAPLVYSPIYGFPTKEKRSTGFLPFNFQDQHSGTPSRKTGLRFRFPYFINFDQEHDLTVIPDIIQNRGLGLGLEYNYAFTEGMLGQARFWNLNESVAKRTPETEYLMKSSDPNQLNRHNWNFVHKQNLWKNGRLFLLHKKNSDNEVNYDYFNTDGGQEIAEQKEAMIYHSWSSGSASLFATKRDLFIHRSRYDQATDYKTSLGVVPRLTLDQSWVLNKEHNIRIYFNGTTSRFERIRGWEGQRSKLNFNASGLYRTQYLNIIPRLAYHHRLYDIRYALDSTTASDSFNQQKKFQQGYFSKYLEINAEFYRISSLSKKGNQEKFILKPRIIYREIDDFDQRKGLNLSPKSSLTDTRSDYETFTGIFDTSDIVLGRKSIALRLDGFLDQKNIHKKTRRLFDFSLIDEYNLNRQDSVIATEQKFVGPQIEEHYQQSPYGTQRLPFIVQARYYPLPGWETRWFNRYDFLKRKAIELGFLAKYSQEKHELSLEYKDNQLSYKTLAGDLHLAVNSVVVGGKVPLFKNIWEMSFSSTWDLKRVEEQNKLNRRLTKSEIAFRYNHCCYDLTFKYEEQVKTGNIGGVTKEFLEHTFRIDFSLLKMTFSDVRR